MSKSKLTSQLPKQKTDDGLHTPLHPNKSIKHIKLQSLEGRVFELDYNIAKMCKTIKAMVEDSEIPIKEDTPIKLNNISNEALTKIIEYINYHHQLPPLPEDEKSKEKIRKSEIKDWDLKFVKSLSKNLLFELIMAANFLYIRGLIDLTCKYVATNYIKDKSVEDVRKEFNIVNDLSPKDELRLKQENSSWADDEFIIDKITSEIDNNTSTNQNKE